MILLDTHIWLWWVLGEERISGAERNKLDELASLNKISISAINIWEAEILERKNKITLNPDFGTWIRKATKPESFKVIPLDTEVILTQRSLPENFPLDPADRLIVATSVLSGYPLATKDQKIIDSGACEIWGA